MIDLSLQFRLIIFSFIFGFMFSWTLDIFNKRIKKYSTTIEIILSFMFIFIMTLIYFIGIQKIGNAIFHIYSIISIIVGFVLYDIIIKIIEKPPKKWYTLYGDDMAKRRISKASKRRLVIFGSASLVAIVIFLCSLLYNIYTIYDLTKEKKNLEEFYEQLQVDAENIKTFKEKLSDSKYLADYAREHYLYSKDGEYILEFGEEDTKEVIDNISNDINKNYILLCLTILMVLIFIYIIKKGKKKKKK